MTKLYSPSTGGFYADDFHTKKQIPADAVKITDGLYGALFAAQAKGQIITMGSEGLPVAADPPPPAPAQLAAMLSTAVQAHLDAAARALGYDNILAAISYADEPSVPLFQKQGAAFRAWRSAVWSAAVPAINAVAAGGPAPAVADFLTTLPTFTPPTA